MKQFDATFENTRHIIPSICFFCEKVQKYDETPPEGNTENERTLNKANSTTRLSLLVICVVKSKLQLTLPNTTT